MPGPVSDIAPDQMSLLVLWGWAEMRDRVMPSYAVCGSFWKEPLISEPRWSFLLTWKAIKMKACPLTKQNSKLGNMEK